MTTESDPTTPRSAALSRSARWGLIALLAVLAAATWFAWLGWDTTYDIDADGNQTGPYAEWQVIGAVLTMVVLAALGALRLGTLPTALGTTIGFAAAWIASAALADESGLWLIGAVLVAFGVFLGAYGVAAATEAVLKARRQ